MRIIKQFVIASTGALCFSAATTAAELTGPEIKAILVGNTIYVEVQAAGSSTGASGNGAIYYTPDGTAYYKTPKGEIWEGKYSFKDNTLCTDWKQAPNAGCTRYNKQGETITLFNTATGVSRGKIVRTATGNPEKLGP